MAKQHPCWRSGAVGGVKNSAREQDSSIGGDAQGMFASALSTTEEEVQDRVQVEV